jgi:hypothetical protein
MPKGIPKDGSKGGRPPKTINWIEFEKLCRIQCTLEEIAAYFEVTPELIERKVVEEKQTTFKEYFGAKHGLGKISLRRKMNQLALKGDRTMLIWLSKNRLGMRDKHEHSGPDGGPIPVSLEGAQAALADMLAEVASRKSETK